MKESELAFWQKTARHYTRSMDRSAPLYAAVCERIRPHLSRDIKQFGCPPLEHHRRARLE